MAETYTVGQNNNEIMGAILSSLTHKYEVSLEELQNLDSYDIETRTQVRSQRVQEIALDISLDLTNLTKYRLGQDTKYNTYYLKHLDAAMQYLRDLRQTLSLFITAERL